MPGSFGEQLDRLAEQVGHGTLEGSLVVDQVYAAPQERGFWETGPNAGVLIRNHPIGGQEHFLSEPVDVNRDDYTRKLADGALDERGLYEAMVDNMEHLSAQVGFLAPVQFGDLRRSGHPTVTDDGALTYDRPPGVERLSAEELRAKARLARSVDPFETTRPR